MPVASSLLYYLSGSRSLAKADSNFAHRSAAYAPADVSVVTGARRLNLLNDWIFCYAQCGYK